MELPSNPFAMLTYISAPAVLTNASCVLLFGTGNRYGRAVDRMHELADLVERGEGLAEAELRFRIRQLESGEARTLLIVRALTCFYTAVAAFVASTLVSLIGAVLVSARMEWGVGFSFTVAFFTGTVGVAAIVTGAIMLARETTCSFTVLRAEKSFISEQVQARVAKLVGSAPAQKV